MVEYDLAIFFAGEEGFRPFASALHALPVARQRSDMPSLGASNSPIRVHAVAPKSCQPYLIDRKIRPSVIPPAVVQAFCCREKGRSFLDSAHIRPAHSKTAESVMTPEGRLTVFLAGSLDPFSGCVLFARARE
jgi:hypothetical protein